MTDTATNLADASTTAPAPPAPVGNPALVGLPAFLVGAFALGLYLTGYLPVGAVGASIPIILTATGIGLVIAATWAARLAQNAVASVFGIFAGFWLSYAALVLGLVHGWLGVDPGDVARTQEVFLLSWLVVIVLLTLTTLRLPLAFTVLFVLVDVALALLFLATANNSTALTHAGGFAVFAFVAVGAYLYAASMRSELGAEPLPLGQPVVG